MKKYNQEFKDSAIQLVLNSNESIKKIAKDLEVHEKTLYAWVREIGYEPKRKLLG